MGMISPQQLYDDPKLWLSVDHEFHDVLGKLMGKLFPDWPEKLKAISCHCLLCEGQELIPCTSGDGKKGLITGWVEKPEKLLNIRDV
jgi:hypothetical protein